MANFVQCSARSCPELEQFLEAVTQQHQQLRSEVSAKLKLSQLSALRSENGSVTVVTGWHLHVCPFFSTCDRYELDCCTNAPPIGKTGKISNQPKCLHSSMATVVQCSAHSCPEPEQATRFLIETGFLEAVTQQHQQLKLFPKQGLRFLPDSSFLSFQHCGGDTLYWSDPLQ